MPSRYGSSGFSGPRKAYIEMHWFVNWIVELITITIHCKTFRGIPEHCCCVRGTCRSHQCWWPQTRSRCWNDQTFPFWSAQRLVSPFWLSYGPLQTLKTNRKTTRIELTLVDLVMIKHQHFSPSHILPTNRHLFLGTCPWRSPASPWPSCWEHWSFVECFAVHSDAAAECLSRPWSLHLTVHPWLNWTKSNTYKCSSWVMRMSQ